MLLCDGIVTKEGQIKPSGPKRRGNYDLLISTSNTLPLRLVYQGP